MIKIHPCATPTPRPPDLNRRQWSMVLSWWNCQFDVTNICSVLTSGGESVVWFDVILDSWTKSWPKISCPIVESRYMYIFIFFANGAPQSQQVVTASRWNYSSFYPRSFLKFHELWSSKFTAYPLFLLMKTLFIRNQGSEGQKFKKL